MKIEEVFIFPDERKIYITSGDTARDEGFLIPL